MPTCVNNPPKTSVCHSGALKHKEEAPAGSCGEGGIRVERLDYCCCARIYGGVAKEAEVILSCVLSVIMTEIDFCLQYPALFLGLITLRTFPLPKFEGASVSALRVCALSPILRSSAPVQQA